MRAVVTYLAIKLVVRLMINMLELAVVYIVARTLFSLVCKSSRWSYDLVASLFRKTITSVRAAKTKAKKLATTIPPPTHHKQRFPLESIPESPMESELSDPEDIAVLVG